MNNQEVTKKIAFSKLKDLKGSEKSVLVTLSLHGDELGSNIDVSISTLASNCSLSERTVRNVIKNLVTLDYVVNCRTGGIINGMHVTNQYYINMYKLD